MIYGLIKKGVCVAVTECDEPAEAERRAAVHGCVAVELPEGYGIGSTYEDGTWGNPLPDPEPVPDPMPTELEQMRADIDYIAMETGVEL